MQSDSPASLRALAAKCRCMSRGVSTRDVAASLNAMADDYERKADAAAAREAPQPPVPPAASV